MDLDRVIRIINYDIDEKVSNSQEQFEAYKIFFKELFNTDIIDENGNYKSVYQIFSEASKSKFKGNSAQISND